jgi:hypothetical protein
MVSHAFPIHWKSQKTEEKEKAESCIDAVEGEINITQKQFQISACKGSDGTLNLQ